MAATNWVINKNTEKALKMSILEARLTKSKEADTEHILLALLKEKNTLIYDILTQFRLDYTSAFRCVKAHTENRARKELDERRSNNDEAELTMPRAGANFTEDDDMGDQSFTPGRGTGNPSQTKGAGSDTPVLDNFGTDITRAALENRLDPVVGRDREIERIAQILSRREEK